MITNVKNENRKTMNIPAVANPKTRVLLHEKTNSLPSEYQMVAKPVKNETIVQTIVLPHSLNSTVPLQQADNVMGESEKNVKEEKALGSLETSDDAPIISDSDTIDTILSDPQKLRLFKVFDFMFTIKHLMKLEIL